MQKDCLEQGLVYVWRNPETFSLLEALARSKTVEGDEKPGVTDPSSK